MGGIEKKTEHASKTFSPLFDKTFTFEFADMKISELELMKINFFVYTKFFDNNPLEFLNSEVGRYEIDLSSVYFQKNHIYHKTWFTLYNLETNGCMGFVKATIEVLGPGDEPYIPDEDDDSESSEKTVISPKIRSKGHVIIGEVFRAESLIPVNLNTRKLDSYVKLKYGGNEVEIDEVDDTANPTFNKCMFLKAMLPNHSKFVYVELWNSNSLMPDDIIGTARVPFNSFKDSLNQKPIWINIYGPPLSSDNKYSKIMAINGYRIGSTYRGRILIRFSSRDSTNPVSGVEDMDYLLPDISVPAPLSKNYTLRIDVCSGSELPAPKHGILHFSLGNYFFKSSLRSIEPKKHSKGVTANSSKIIWNENLPDRKVFLPMDPRQIPDLMIYFCDEDVESHRTVFYRLKASEILVTNNKSFEATSKTRLIKFREDKSKKRLEADQFAGFVVCRIQLFSFKPSLRDFFNFVSTKNIKTYELTFFVYVGRDLPSGNEDGSCKPVLEFICGNQRESIIPKSYSNKMPTFDEKGNLVDSNENKENVYLKIYDILDSRKDLAKNKSNVKKNKKLLEEEKETLEHFEFESKFMNENKHVTSMNPNFYQAVTMNIEINDDNLVPPSVIIILLKHQKYDKNGKKTESVLLGRYWMSLETDKNVLLKDKIESDVVSMNFVFQKPIWIPMIYDKKEKIDGKILMSYSLIELDEDEMALREQFRQAVFNSPDLFSNIVHKGYIRNFGENYQESLPLMTKYHLWPDSNIENLNIYFMGFRNIGIKNKKTKDMSCLVRIHGVIDKFETNMDNENPGDKKTTSVMGKTRSQLQTSKSLMKSQINVN